MWEKLLREALSVAAAGKERQASKATPQSVATERSTVPQRVRQNHAAADCDPTPSLATFAGKQLRRIDSFDSGRFVAFLLFLTFPSW